MLSLSIHGLSQIKCSGPTTRRPSVSTSGYPVTQEKSRNSLGLFSKLVWSAGLCGLPQFDRISLRVMHAGKPARGIGRVNLDLDSCGL